MRIKILCLHGYAMNSQWLREWLLPVETALADCAELVYPQGPHVCQMDEVRAMSQQYQISLPATRIGERQNWCWFRASDDKPPVYRLLQPTLDFLQQYCREHGPVNGVIGWSQGAALAAMPTALQQNNTDYDFGLEWAVLCGGFLPGDVEVRRWFSMPINLPSMHVVGSKESDWLRSRAEKLCAVFVDGDWLATPTGHVMPIHYPEYMQAISDWIRNRTG